MAAAYLTEVLLHPNPGVPFEHIGETQLVSLRKLVILFQYRLKKPGAPSIAVQTSSTQSVGETSTQRVKTSTTPRMARRITAPSPRVGTFKTPAPTIPSA